MFELILAVDEHWGFSNKGKLPWNCKEDLNNFKKLTDNKHIIMGRKTWDSIPQKLFVKNKICTIVSNNDFKSELKDNINIINEINNINSGILIGGKSLVLQLYNKIDIIYLTKVKGTYECDIFFNEINNILENFNLVSKIETKFAIYYIYRSASCSSSVTSSYSSSSLSESSINENPLILSGL